MPSHSFARLLCSPAAIVSLLALPQSMVAAFLSSSCDNGPFGSDILRAELNSDIFSSNSTLAQQRGIYLWVGNQYWRTDITNGRPSRYPILAVLSTSYNQTYISTSPAGSKDAPCPSSYTYNNANASNPSLPSGDCCTFDSSYTCHGYYDLSTSVPIPLETKSNFTGSPEDSSSMNELQSADVRYGITNVGLILPETSGSESSPLVTVAFYESGPSEEVGFVDSHDQQVVGLGFNSTFLNALYDAGYISSRSLGLYYGVPAAAGADLERNGSMVLGGYSSDRLKGEFSSKTYPLGRFSLPRQCPWEVDVANVTSGTETSTVGFTACVEPDELGIVLPSALYKQFAQISGSSLSITLTNGLVAEIPSGLVSLRSVDDADQSPILGAPFLSQIYIFADYQERTLSTGMANNEPVLLPSGDDLQCVEHSNSTGSLGWATGSPTDLLQTTPTQSTSPSSTKSAAVKVQGEAGWLLSIAAFLAIFIA